MKHIIKSSNKYYALRLFGDIPEWIEVKDAQPIELKDFPDVEFFIYHHPEFFDYYICEAQTGLCVHGGWFKQPKPLISHVKRFLKDKKKQLYERVEHNLGLYGLSPRYEYQKEEYNNLTI